MATPRQSAMLFAEVDAFVYEADAGAEIVTATLADSGESGVAFERRALTDAQEPAKAG